MLASFSPPDLHEITEEIKALKNNKAPGPDGYTGQTLKRNVDFFAPILLHVTTLILKSGEFPRVLKDASVILIHKEGNIDDLSNYRPVSLLSVFSKIVEKLIAKRLTAHLDVNHIWSEQQFGFRKKGNTQEAILFFRTTFSRRGKTDGHLWRLCLITPRRVTVYPMKDYWPKLKVRELPGWR